MFSIQPRQNEAFQQFNTVDNRQIGGNGTKVHHGRNNQVQFTPGVSNMVLTRSRSRSKENGREAVVPNNVYGG